MTAQAITLPKLTIVTVVYNAINSLERTILSVIEQDYPNIEYLIIDGGSNDGSVDLIKKHQEKITYWCSERDQGIYDAMNKGLKRSTGDWICFLNADDCFVDSQVLGKVANALQDPRKNYYSQAIIEHQGKELYRAPNYIPEPDWVKKVHPVHQTIFIAKKYKEFTFDLSYRILADRDQIRRIAKISQFDFIDVATVRYSLDGFSGKFASFKHTKHYADESRRFLSSYGASQKEQNYAVFVCWVKFLLFGLFNETVYYKLIAFIRRIRK